MRLVANRHLLPCVLTAVVVIISLNGCSFSNSSESSSKIVSSPFKSISGSSSAEGSTKYDNEVRDYTNAYVRSSTSDYAGFKSGLGDIAARHGVTNWEVQPATYVAIGRGLKKAKIKGIEYETFKKNLAAGDYSKMQDIERGYESK